jgi:imidazolonepropionase-like amidohydrolase
LYKNQTLKIKDGKIVSLSSTDVSSDIPQAMKEGAKVVDAKDWFLCPGLIDCHVHITGEPRGLCHISIKTGS